MPSAFRTVHDWVVRDVARPMRAPLKPPSGSVQRLAAPSGRSEPWGRPELRRLPAGAVVGFAVEEGARVTCLGGELWVTGPGTDDQILTTGESLSVIGAGRVVAEALRDARFVILR